MTTSNEAAAGRGTAGAAAAGFVRFEGCSSFAAETAAAARALFQAGPPDAAALGAFRALLARACAGAQETDAKFRFRIRCPLYVAWRLFAPLGAGGTGVDDAAYLPPVLQLGLRQPHCRCAGRRGVTIEPDFGRAAQAMVDAAYRVALDTYRYLCAAGIDAAQAQAVLPLAAYTEFELATTAGGLVMLWHAVQAEDLPPGARRYGDAVFKALRDEAPVLVETLATEAAVRQV